MALQTSPICDFGRPAPDFRLPATEGRTYTRDEIAGPNGLLIMFICNHCPYVKAVADRIARDGRDLQAYGIGVAAVCSNDARTHPEDSFDNMTRFAEAHRFSFPYLHDESQEVARAYEAICTPDFFGYDAGLGLQYRGRLDASGARPGSPDLPRELFEAMRGVAETGRGPEQQVASMGCSIKWVRG